MVRDECLQFFLAGYRRVPGQWECTDHRICEGAQHGRQIGVLQRKKLGDLMIRKELDQKSWQAS